MAVWRAGAVTALILLAGCNNGGLPGQNASGADTSAATESGTKESQKLSAYTSAYNKLIGTFGLTETADSYEKENISAKSASDSINVTDGWLSQGVDLLDKAIAIPGDLGALDVSAKALRDAVSRAQQHIAALDIYYDSKAYKDDGLARGKKEDAQMLNEFAAARAALSRFDGELTKLQRARDQKLLEGYKAKGNMLAYNGKLALRQAEDLIDLFHKSEDLKDPAVIAKANTQVTALEKTLADLRAAIDAAKAKKDSDQSSDLTNFGLVADNLTSTIGYYRQLRDSHSASDHKSMVDAYNRAIDDANDIEQ